MRTALYTGYDNAYRQLAELTIPRMARYAEIHGMEFRPFTEEPVGMNIYWTGMARGMELFNQGFERIFYLDVDELITNLDMEFPAVTTGIHLSKDWGKDAVEPWHFSACGFVAFRDAIPFFQRVLDLAPAYEGQPFQEQQPMRDIARQWMEGVPLREKSGPENGLINIHPRRIFNAVPDAVCPGEVPEPWQRGDFAAHLTMAPLEQRIDLARKILNNEL